MDPNESENKKIALQSSRVSVILFLKRGKKMKITLLIPMYNERNIIESTLSELSSYMRETFGEDYEILFVNDGSKDGCEEVVSAFSDPSVRLVSYGENRGKGYAIRRGVEEARGEVVFFTDCDLAYGESVIGDVFHRLQNGAADVIIGSRTLHPNGYEGYSPFRKAVSENYLKVLNRIMKISHSDFQCGLKGFTKEARDKIFPFCTVNGYAFDLEVLLLAEKEGLSVSEIPVKVLSEAKHKAKLKMLPEAIKMIRDVNKIKKGSTDLTRKGDGN